jgi:hypothetical protein
VNAAVADRITDLIVLAQRLRAAVEAETPQALLPTFPLMRLGIDIDSMAVALEEHAEKLIHRIGGV